MKIRFWGKETIFTTTTITIAETRTKIPILLLISLPQPSGLDLEVDVITGVVLEIGLHECCICVVLVRVTVILRVTLIL